VISFGAELKIMLAMQPVVDFRKSVHTLSALVSEALHADPYCGDIFVFRSKRADRVKLLGWDGSGMVLVTKWLEDGRFTWPPIRDGVVHLTATSRGFTYRNFLVDVLTIFVFIRWFWLLISVAGDLFRRHDISGWGKPIWVVKIARNPLKQSRPPKKLAAVRSPPCRFANPFSSPLRSQTCARPR
jgi:transposase